MILGAHMSISGGVEKALERAASYNFKTTAMFVRNQVQWRVSPLADRTVELFRDMRKKVGIAPVVAHASYLVNLAGLPEIRGKSAKAMIEDLSRCDRLGIEYLVFHPGSNANERAGLTMIAESLDEIFAAVEPGPMILLETTAGQGDCLGWRFEQLAAIIEQARHGERLGVCLDTCHVFAAGYDVRSAEGYAKTIEQFDRTVGLSRLKAIHVNDSLKDQGSRVDRHAHIGKGKLGLEGLANFVRDGRLSHLPFILETPKGADPQGRDYDKLNSDALLSLVKR